MSTFSAGAGRAFVVFAAVATAVCMTGAATAGDTQAAAFAQRCQALVDKAKFSVRFEDTEVARDDSRGRAELRALSSQAPAPGHHVYGLTHGQAGVRYRMRAAVLVDSDGSACAVPSVDVAVSVRGLKVFLARELDTACKRGVVDRHEQEHVAVWRGHLRRGAERLEPALRERLARVFRFDSAKQAQAALRNEVDAIVRPALDAMQDEIREANAQIDSPQSYRETSRQLDACG